jgi:GrpB-like predicted nucleotidyltransferase (UPF0157 family)/uncharacterized protein YciI
MFIALLHYKVSRDILESYLPAHYEFLKEGYKKNVFIASGRMYSGKGGVILSPLTRRGEFEQFLRQDPFVIHNLVTLEIIGFEPSRFHSDFGPFIQEPEKFKIDLVPHSPQWDMAFQEESKIIADILGRNFITLHHIGSTAIPGILAKPILDILPVVKNIHEVDPLTFQFEALGYEAKEEYGMPGRRFFLKSKNGKRLCNVHIFEEGHPDIERHLLFRDYMRAHPQEAAQYSQLKEELVAKSADDIERYCWGKEDFIKEMEKRALQWQSHQPKNDL